MFILPIDTSCFLLQDLDPAYSEEMLDVAKELFDFGDQRRENYQNSIPDAAGFYKYVGAVFTTISGWTECDTANFPSEAYAL